MKSSTIRRSTLSRQTMEVIENLAKEQEISSMPNEYVRTEEKTDNHLDENFSNKAQEIDLLWQNFKTTQFNTNSPAAYVIMGFLSGVVFSVLVFMAIGAFVKSDVKFAKKALPAFEKVQMAKNNVSEQTLEQQADSAQDTVEMKVSVPGENETTVDMRSQQNETKTIESTEAKPVDLKNSKKYIVKSGDTGESIIKHYYGSWSQEKADLVMKANNLTNLDRINIGQELIIPAAE